MPIDRARVRHVARLARLQLSEQEEERIAAELGKVLEYIERLAAVDVSGIEPLSFAGEDEESGGALAALREDQPKPSLPREKVLAMAPQQDGQAFVVPRIIE